MTSRSIRELPLAIAALITLAACHRAPAPIGYALPPGVSASFPPSQLAASAAFARTFCSVLGEPAFAADRWDSCDRYLQMAARPEPQPLGPPSREWTVLLVGGFSSPCFGPEVVTFADAAAHLQEAHGIASHQVPIGAFETSEANAARIRDFVTSLPDRRFIALTHSKGAADFMVALASYPRELARVEALVTVAGAVGGSFLADDFADLHETVLRKLARPSCRPSAYPTENGVDSMRRGVRQAYLARTEPIWRAYSISAVSTREGTSQVLRGFWKRVAPYAAEQDSHIVERESIVPGGAFLGRALGDHWAVAMPFAGNPVVPKGVLAIVDRNRYPRPALVEAALRAVATDLQERPPAAAGAGTGPKRW